MLHGWTGSNESWDEFYQDNDIENIYGVFDEDDHVFWAMPNATNTHDYYQDCCTFLCIFNCDFLVDSTLNDNLDGPDNMFNNNATDDDVQWVFPNENNQLLPGCLYAYSFNVGKNNDGTIFKNAVLASTAPCDDCSDNNEAAAYKQGYALKRAIEAVLAANPGKGKVILAAHSMGGLCGREYLQRLDQNGNPQWWVDSTQQDGHKVAKLITLGTPHRGSNTFGNVTFNESSNRNDLPDLRSEGIRDLRYSYEDGSLNDDIPGVYLYGGAESGISDFAFSYWSKDVNCDGDENDEILGINENGTNQGFAEVWDGTIDNPILPLPLNIKYTYYVSDADVAVDEKRQWLFEGGTGSVSDFNDGTSVSVPRDAVDHRRSDRINVSRFHLNQTDDVVNVIRALDEPDYPDMAYEIVAGQYYFGLAQKRATKVPDSSEYSLLGNNEIDGDWFALNDVDTAYQYIITFLPHPGLSGRLDFYGELSDNTSNTNVADTTLSWPVGTDTILLKTKSGNYFKSFLRISHDVFSTTGNVNDVWKSPYYFILEPVRPCVNNLSVSGLQEISTYRAGETIISDASVVQNGNMQFYAGQSVDLLPGFSVDSTALFSAQIDSCIID